MNPDLQPVRPEDEPFLFELYASTRGDEMALVGWNKPQQEAFLRMQFNAQRSSYAMQFPNADYRIDVHDGRAAGRLIVSARQRFCLQNWCEGIFCDICYEFRASAVRLPVSGALFNRCGKYFHLDKQPLWRDDSRTFRYGAPNF